MNSWLTALAMSRARDGEVLSTATLISTVSSGADAVIWSASLSGVVVRPSRLITGCRTSGEVTICAYDFTRCWVKIPPWAASARLSEDDCAETNSCVCASYTGVCIFEMPTAAPPPSSMQKRISSQRLRRMRP